MIKSIFHKWKFACMVFAFLLLPLPAYAEPSHDISQPILQSSPQTVVYTGDPQAYQPIVGGVNDVDVSAVQLLYRPAEDGIYSPEPPVDAGEYLVRMSYDGDATHLSAEAESTLSILKAEYTAIPAEVLQTERESVVFTTENNQRYMLLPADYASPSIGVGNWIDGTGYPFEWDGLNVGTNYTIYTYAPASRNYNQSILALTNCNTTHEFSYGVKTINYDAAYPENTTYKDESVEVKVTNTGTGKLRDVMVYISGDTKMLDMDMDAFTGMLESGQSQSFIIKPAEDAPEGTYQASIIVKAVGNEKGSGELFQSESIDLKFKVESKPSPQQQGTLDSPTPASETPASAQPQSSANTSVPTSTYQQPDTQPQAGQVTQPLTADEGISAANRQVDGGLIASLNSMISENQSSGSSDGNDAYQQQVAVNPPGEYNSGRQGSDNAVDEATIDEEQSSTEDELQRLEKRSIAQRKSSLIWFYVIVLLAAVIFGLAIYWADNALHRRPTRRMPGNRGGKHVRGKSDPSML